MSFLFSAGDVDDKEMLIFIAINDGGSVSYTPHGGCDTSTGVISLTSMHLIIYYGAYICFFILFLGVLSSTILPTHHL